MTDGRDDERREEIRRQEHRDDERRKQDHRDDDRRDEALRDDQTYRHQQDEKTTKLARDLVMNGDIDAARVLYGLSPAAGSAGASVVGSADVWEELRNLWTSVLDQAFDLAAGSQQMKQDVSKPLGALILTDPSASAQIARVGQFLGVMQEYLVPSNELYSKIQALRDSLNLVQLKVLEYAQRCREMHL